MDLRARTWAHRGIVFGVLTVLAFAFLFAVLGLLAAAAQLTGQPVDLSALLTRGPLSRLLAASALAGLVGVLRGPAKRAPPKGRLRVPHVGARPSLPGPAVQVVRLVVLRR